MGARYSGFLLDPCSNLERKSADLAQNLQGLPWEMGGVIMAASPSLSHSSQDKAENQGKIEYWQGVSDECSSGVVRVVQEAQSIPGVCSLCADY